MTDFKTDREAIKYATENIGKHGSVICTVNEKKTFLCSTIIPVEERLREPVEIAVQAFLEELGVDEGDVEDLAAEIGAEASSILVKLVEKHAGCKILSAYMDY